MGKSHGPDAVEVCFRVSFVIPEERFGGESPTVDTATGVAVEMLRRFTSEFIVPSEVTVDPDDPRIVTAEIYLNDDPDRPGYGKRHDDALEAIMRSLGHRCSTGEPDGEWKVDLHSDVGLLDVLAAEEWAEKSDRGGRIYGYPMF